MARKKISHHQRVQLQSRKVAREMNRNRDEKMMADDVLVQPWMLHEVHWG